MISETPELSLFQFALKHSALCFSPIHPSSSVVLFRAYMFAMSTVFKEQSQVREFSWTFRTGMVLLRL